jgi:hypothetical protein
LEAKERCFPILVSGFRDQLTGLSTKLDTKFMGTAVRGATSALNYDAVFDFELKETFVTSDLFLRNSLNHVICQAWVELPGMSFEAFSCGYNRIRANF